MSYRHLRWVAVAVGLLALARGGASIFTTPDDEVLYATDPPITTCLTHGCTLIYRLEIGNTGRNPRRRVRVHLQTAVVDRAILPPRFRNFGKVERPVTTGDEAGIRTYDLGPVKPQQRVELQLVLQVPDRSDAPRWDEILAGVDADTGEVRRGSPAGTTFARWMYAIFGGWG
jgi:hypothetical protein